MPIENFIIAVYYLTNDLSKEVLGEKKLRKRGFKAELSDSEVITMEIVGEFLGIDTDKGAWEYCLNHWRKLPREAAFLFSSSLFSILLSMTLRNACNRIS